MTKKKRKLGCFTFVAILLTSAIASSVLQSFFPISLISWFGLLLVCISWGIGRANRDTDPKVFSRYLMYSTITIGVLYVIRNTTQSTIVKNSPLDISENIYKERFYENGDSINLYSQDRNWSDNYGNAYEGHFSVRELDYFESRKQYYNRFKTQDPTSWKQLYQYLSDNDTPRLDLILNTLSEIKSTEQLNSFEFAEMVVTFVQDIPYSFVFGEQCLPANRYENSIRVVLEQCPSCCIGNTPYGIQNPVAFMGNLKGDCDTRTVLIYAILNYYGYDVAILNSQFYKHSILGLNLPAKGKYKLYQGKRYYVWETTNKHFTLGKLPENVKNINHWEIILTNT